MRIDAISSTLLWTTFLSGVGCQLQPRSDLSPEDARAAPRVVSVAGPAKVLVGYYSVRGNTEKMAAAVAEGASGVPGVTVVKKPVAEITRSDLESARGVILGCPTYFANIPGEMKTTIDHWAWKMRVDFTDRVGGAFATGGNFTGGKEHVVISLLLYMLNNRMVVVGPIYREGEGGWGEIGASATTGADDPGLGEAELTAARKLGERVARVVHRWTAP